MSAPGNPTRTSSITNGASDGFPKGGEGLGGAMIDRTKGYYDESQETMPPKEREAFRRTILRETVRHAYENAPAARRKMDEAGVKPADVQDIGDLAKIPLTRKADLKNLQKA